MAIESSAKISVVKKITLWEMHVAEIKIRRASEDE